MTAPTPIPPVPPEDPSREGSDYLWDRSGTPDPLVQQLENTLAGYRLQELKGPKAEPEAVAGPVIARLGGSRARRLMSLAAALLIVGALVAGYTAARSGAGRDVAGWEVAEVSGAPRAGSRELAAGRVLAVGEWMETDGASSATVRFPEVGKVTVSPNSRLRIDAASVKHEMNLDYGHILASIDAPAEIFFVRTRAALATDMGCRYELEMPKTGRGTLTVTLGWVLLEGAPGKNNVAWTARVPSGARCYFDEQNGPGTPFRVGATTELQEALSQLDLARWPRMTAPELEGLLQRCGLQDGLTVWHVLQRVASDQRATVYAHLRSIITVPNTLADADVMALEARAMEKLWNIVRFN